MHHLLLASVVQSVQPFTGLLLAVCIPPFTPCDVFLCHMLKNERKKKERKKDSISATSLGCRHHGGREAMNHWLRWRPSLPLFTPRGCWCEQMKTARRSHRTHLFTRRQLQGPVRAFWEEGGSSAEALQHLQAAEV